MHLFLCQIYKCLQVILKLLMMTLTPAIRILLLLGDILQIQVSQSFDCIINIFYYTQEKIRSGAAKRGLQKPKYKHIQKKNYPFTYHRYRLGDISSNSLIFQLDELRCRQACAVSQTAQLGPELRLLTSGPCPFYYSCI